MENIFSDDEVLAEQDAPLEPIVAIDAQLEAWEAHLEHRCCPLTCFFCLTQGF